VTEVHSKGAGWEVGATRSPDKTKSWEDKGIENFKGDLEDKQPLIAAFKDADAILSTPNSCAPFYNSATPKLREKGQTINEYCHENELQQGKTGIWLMRPLQSKTSIVSSSQHCAMLKRGATANILRSNKSSMSTSSTQSWRKRCLSFNSLHTCLTGRLLL
jgi:hypothetical protein